MSVLFPEISHSNMSWTSWICYVTQMLTHTERETVFNKTRENTPETFSATQQKMLTTLLIRLEVAELLLIYIVYIHGDTKEFEKELKQE